MLTQGVCSNELQYSDTPYIIYGTLRIPIPWFYPSVSLIKSYPCQIPKQVLSRQSNKLRLGSTLGSACGKKSWSIQSHLTWLAISRERWRDSRKKPTMPYQLLLGNAKNGLLFFSIRVVDVYRTAVWEDICETSVVQTSNGSRWRSSTQ
jgi:hypothetical protein